MTPTISTATQCPKCGSNGKVVKTVTLRALLKPEDAATVVGSEQDHCESGCTPAHGSTGWRFCNSPDCDVVYFGEQNGIAFTKSQLSVAVGVKETAGERPLCYCFGHSVATITEELRTKGASDALDDIRRKMKDPGCSCEVKNPSGSCCLGTVAKGIETTIAELGSGPNAAESAPAANRAERITKAGTILSAVMASACCWLPLLLLAFGVSGAGIAGALETYRPLFIALTFGFLAAAFYLTYRPRKGGGSASDCCSTAHACCVAPGEGTKRWFSMMAANKVVLWVVTMLAVAFLFFPKYVGLLMSGLPTENAPTNTELVRTTTIAIEGMTCEGCSVGLERAIKDIPHVTNARIDFAKKHAVVYTETCCAFPEAEVLKAITDAGFSGTLARSN